MATNQPPEMAQDMESAQEMPGDNKPGADETAGEDTNYGGTVTLDATDPAVEPLKDCQEGEILTVLSNDGETIKLRKGDAESATEDSGEGGEEGAGGEEPKGAMAILIARKKKA
jgi:hypothetical protein